MIPWSVTMRPTTLTLNCVLAMGLLTCIGAITVSIDRSDNKPPPTRSSMIANGWRPLTNGYEETIGTNVSPSTNLERNGPVHPVLGKFQEHMAVSEKLKPQRKGKPSPHHDYNPPSILGSFSVMGHAAAKARGEAQSGHNHPNKHIGSETREYTFLIPPPKDAYRFDLDQHRKPILRDNSAYLRQPQFGPPAMHQPPPDPIKAATYFIKGYTSTTNSPSSAAASTKIRHYADPYVPQLLQPPRYQVKPFESLKVSNNAKPYFQPPGTALASDFGKDKRLTDFDPRPNYEKFPGQSHVDHVLNTGGSGNFFGQINHQPHGYKTSYERDPAFLVHESHEISYITPPSVYNPFNFRPSLPYETLLPPDIYSSSTPAPTTPRPQETNKYQQQQSGDSLLDYKRPGQGSTVKQIESGGQSELSPTAGIANTYYVSEHQDLTPPPASWPAPKNQYTADINEVLPRVNPPSKFSPEPDRPSQVPQVPKVVYVSPQAQAPQYQSSVLPIDIRPESGETEYETPESISLKHFNEQQYLIQQQLLQRDRQRLAEQERQQQLEIEKQQQEELKKRQEELRQLLEQQKEDEEARLAVESVKNQSEQLAKVAEEQGGPFSIQLTEYEIPKVTTDFAAVITEQSGVGEQPKVQQSQVTQPEYIVSESPEVQNQHYQDHSKNQQEQVNYRDQQTDLRPQRPHKPFRDQYRRRKPSTVAYEPTPTEAPVQVPETSVPVTLHIEEVPIHTTATPETETLAPASTQKPRTRRPGAPLRRRRPTTTTPEPLTVPASEDYFIKYDKPEEPSHQVLDTAKRRRPAKPTQPTFDAAVTEKKANIRKRPGHRNRVNPGEPFEAEIVTEIIHTPANTYKGPTESVHAYNEYNQFVTNQPNQPFDYTSQRFVTADEQREDTTQSLPAEYFTEPTRAKPQDIPDNENYNLQQGGVVATNIPLEDLFVRTEGNYFDRATAVSSSSTSASGGSSTSATTIAPTTTSTTQSTTQPSSTTRSQKIRPIRYGNTTRPRFSIKDYKSRMDYKTKLAHMSSTEAPVTQATHPKHNRGSIKNQQSQQSQQNGDSNRETTGRYKYVPRMNYRTSSPSPLTPKEPEVDDTSSYSTTERSHRFVPKRRPTSGNVYRSRITGTVSTPVRSQNHYDSAGQSKPSTARPENVFSSSVRRRPVMKSRLPAQKDSSTSGYPDKKETEATEMAAEETSFYSAITTTGTTRLVANDIPTEKEETSATNSPIAANAEESETEPTPQTENERPAEPVASSTAKNVDESQLRETGIAESYSAANNEETTTAEERQPETTTAFEVRSEEEELFAKASQSVADLTSSASALYDKPGMFKAVSPESRVVSPHFKIATDEPTLPIEAFFQELTKKS